MLDLLVREFLYEHVLRINGYAGLTMEGFINVEDPHQPDVVQLTIPKYSWKVALDYLLPLLKGKQFERGGFVTSHSDQ